MAEINHEIKINAPADKIFKAITTLDGLKSWHTANVTGNCITGDSLKFQAQGKPGFTWKVIEMQPNKKLVLECVEGPGDSKGTQAVYELSSRVDGRTLVEFKHTAWPTIEGNYRKCNTLWGILLHHLKNYVETGKQQPLVA